MTNKRIDLADREEINPMIERTGELYRVADALEALALLVGMAAAGSVDISQTANHGISAMLDTCAAALRQMEEFSE